MLDVLATALMDIEALQAAARLNIMTDEQKAKVILQIVGDLTAYAKEILNKGETV